METNEYLYILSVTDFETTNGSIGKNYIGPLLNKSLLAVFAVNVETSICLYLVYSVKRGNFFTLTDPY